MSALADGELLPVEPDDDEIRDWLFTFGSGHRLLISPAHGGEPQGRGIPLDKRYVRITGTWEAARERMVELFGTSFASQYSSEADAGVDDYRLTELVLPEVSR